MNPGMPRALLFDLDQTLVFSHGMEAASARTCRHISSRYSDIEEQELISECIKDWQEVAGEKLEDWVLGRLTGKEVSLIAWRRILGRFGIQSDSEIEEASALNISHIQKTYECYNDVPGIIETVKSLNLQTGLVTNGASDTQREKLATIGLSDWFDVLVVSGDLGIAKPDPGTFRPALDTLKLDPRLVWHIGDSLESDVAGANAAGIVSVWLNRTGRKRTADSPRPDLEVGTLDELIMKLQGLGT